MRSITNTIKYILIGIGALASVSGLVWVGTSQNNSPPVSQVTVEEQPKVDRNEQAPKLDETSTAHAHGTSERLTNDLEEPSNVHIDGKSVAPDSELPKTRGDALRPRNAHTDKLPGELPAETVTTSEQPSLEVRQAASQPDEIVAALGKSPVNQAIDDERLEGSDEAEPTIEEFVEEPVWLTESPEEERVSEEPIAPPVFQESLPEEPIDYGTHDSMNSLTEEEPQNTEPQMIAKSESTMEHPKQPQGAAELRDDRGYKLEVLGIQGGFNTKYVAIPPTEKEDFEHFAVFGAMSFPKRYTYDSGWEIRFRLNGSMGALHSSGDLGFITTIVPGIVFWYPEWNISINGGPGLAYISREKYGEQDLGGPIQIVGQGGLTYYITDHIGIGWRFHHISDAGIWGSDNRGVDVNLFELMYKF